jgi:hypothetical protein
MEHQRLQASIVYKPTNNAKQDIRTKEEVQSRHNTKNKGRKGKGERACGKTEKNEKHE